MPGATACKPDVILSWAWRPCCADNRRHCMKRSLVHWRNPASNSRFFSSDTDGSRTPHSLFPTSLYFCGSLNKAVKPSVSSFPISDSRDTCAERCGLATRSEWPQTRKRNHPLHCEMDTSRVDGVKAPLHFKTRRSRLLAVVELRRKLSFYFIQDGDLLRG